MMVRSMLHGMKNRLRGQTTREIGVVLTGHSVRLGMGIISSALLARGLSPEGLSVFTVVGAWVAILGTFADFGLRNSAVRQIARQATENPALARQVASQFARLKMLITVLVALGVGVFAEPLAELLHLPPETGRVLVLFAGGWIMATAFSGILAAVLQALRLFPALMGAQTLNIVATVILMGGLFFVQQLTLVTGLIVGGVAALLAGGYGLWALPAEWRQAFFQRGGWDAAIQRDLWKFGRWVWLGMLFAILHVQFDILLVSRFVPAQEAGYYALAFNLAQKSLMLYQTLYMVFLPQVSALANGQELWRYLLRNTGYALAMCGLVGLTMVFARPAIELVYGSVYLPSVNLYLLLVVPVIIDLLALPMILLIYPLNLPRMEMGLNGLRLVLLVGMGFLLVPRWGVYGAAIAKVIATLASSGFIVAMILRRLAGHDVLRFSEAHKSPPEIQTDRVEL